MPPIKVLLCDDEKNVRLVLKTLCELEDDVEVVGEAENGEEAVAVAALSHPDIVVLDLAMPGGDGLKALPKLRRVSPASRVIVFSAHNPRLAAPKALSLGAHRYLQKDCDPDVVIQAIKEVS